MTFRPAVRTGSVAFISRHCAIAAVMWLIVATAGVAAEPSVTTMVRKGAAPGESFNLTLGGKGLAGDLRLWTSFSEPMPLASTPPDNGKTDGYCTFAVKVPLETPLGVHALRVFSPGGVSAILPFLVDDLPTVEKAGGNQSLAKAQEIVIPGAVDGRVDNLTRDYYRFKAAAGQRVSFEVFCRRLGSPMDASLYLYDARGRILAYSDDAEGLSSDPQFVFSFDKAGDYIVELRDIRYSGGDAFGYHLRIGDFPCVHTALPLAAKRGATTRIDFAGVSCSDSVPATITVPADWKADWFPVSTRRPGGKSGAFATVAVVDHDEVLDHEPNNNLPQAQKMPLGPSISGRFDQPGDVDQFTFTATKGQRYQFAGFTRDIGAPSDLTFRMLDAEGKPIATADDNGASEGILDVTFPADGAYTLELVDLNKRGGPQYSYRVVPSLYRPGFTLSASTDAMSIPAGGTATITITAARRDYAGPIELAVAGLPPEVTSGPAYLGPGDNQVTATISASKTAAPMSLATIVVKGTAVVQETPIVEEASLETVLRARWSGLTQVAPRFENDIALAVSPAQGIALRVEPAEVVFGANLRANVRVVVERAEGFDGPVKLATVPEKDGLPPNVALELKPIPAGQNEVTLTFTANDKVAMGPSTVTLYGTHEKDKVAIAATAPHVTVRLKEAFQLAATATASPVLTRGNQLKFKIALTRNPAFQGPVHLTCEKLPAGVTAPVVRVEADKNEAEVVLSAAPDAAPLASTEVVVRAVPSTESEAKISSTIPLPAFSVQ